MDHSIESYLQRQPAQVLVSFLCRCMQQEQWSSYANLVPMVFEILQSRQVSVSKPVLDSWQTY